MQGGLRGYFINGALFLFLSLGLAATVHAQAVVQSWPHDPSADVVKHVVRL